MFIKVLGVIDLIAAVSLLLSSILPKEWVLLMGIYLLLKGGLFLLSGDLMSLLDITVAIYFILVANEISMVVVTALATLFLLQKGAFSVLS